MVEGWDLQIVGVLSLILIAIICFAGLKYVVKFQLALFGLLVLSILAFIIGAFIPSLHTNFSAGRALAHKICCPTGTAMQHTKVKS